MSLTNLMDISVIFSVVISIISVLIAGLSLLYSHRAFALAKKQDNRQSSNFAVYVENSASYRNQRDDARIYQLAVNISNNSDSPNSISMIELQIDFEIDDNLNLPVKVPISFANSEDGKIVSVDRPPLYFSIRETRKINLIATLKDTIAPAAGDVEGQKLVIQATDLSIFNHPFETNNEKPIF